MGMMSRSRWMILTLLALAAVPWVTGCSTLGIAKVEDLQAAETRMANQNTSTNADLKATKQDLQRLQEWNAKNQASMDSLSAEIAEVREWVATLDVEDIAKDASFAKAVAEKGEERWMGILERLIGQLRSRQTQQAEELQYLEGLWNALQVQSDPSGTAPEKDEGSSDDAGG